MKNALILCALAMNAYAAQPVLVRVTAETLADLQRRDPMIRLVKPSESETKVAKPLSDSIISQSTILHDGTHWTLVPKGAVVFLPEAMKQRVNVRPIGTLLPWSGFLKKNRNWLVSQEVNFDQAAGNEALPSGADSSWLTENKVVVAVHQDGPISVRVAEAAPALTYR
jgi:hypothetical protein